MRLFVGQIRYAHESGSTYARLNSILQSGSLSDAACSRMRLNCTYVGQSKLSGIEWTADATATTIEDVHVDHRCANISVPEQFLHRVDIIAIFDQMRREGVT
jgi:hypothetical protein